MAVGTVLNVLSLAPWVMLLIGSVFLFDSPSNTGVAYLVILGLLGKPEQTEPSDAETARALRIGDPMARARELYGDTEPTGTHYGDGAPAPTRTATTASGTT